MNLHDRFLQLNRLCDLIRRKATGTPDQLAEKLQISRGTLYILTIKWFATANLLNACLRVDTSAGRSAFTLRSGLRLS